MIKKICITCEKFFDAYSKSNKFCSRDCYHKSRIGKNSWNIGLTKSTDERIKKVSDNLKGRKAWNEGLTKETDERVKKASVNMSKAKKGSIPWNVGLTKENDERIRKIAEKVSKHRKNKTYEELMGKEKAKKVKLEMSKSREGEKNSFYGKHHTEEFKESQKIKRTGVPNPHTKEQNRKIGIAVTGENNGFWKGGISHEPYTIDFNYKVKKYVKERDGKCMLCKTSLLNLKELKRKIHIHHVDYNKTNSFPQNLITLCHNCHSLTHIDRNKWTKHFQSILKEEYKYEYTENQKIVLDFVKGDSSD